MPYNVKLKVEKIVYDMAFKKNTKDHILGFYVQVLNPKNMMLYYQNKI